MFGQSIKVDLVFSQYTKEKEVRFQPGTKWVNLNTMEIISIPQVQPEFGIMMKAGIEDPVNMFQAQQSIVVMQDAKALGVTLIEDLRHVPLQISIALGDASTATGFIYIEEGPSAQNKSQNYQVTATPNRITFLNETDRTVISSNISQIASITVSFLQPNQFANASCAIMIDASIETLYVSTYDFEARGQVKITPKYLPDPGQPDFLDLNRLKQVRYGVAQAGQEATLCQQ